MDSIFLRRKMNDAPFRILFITANRIGDATLSLGVLAHLVETYPAACFTIACGPATADLFRAVPRLETLHVLKKLPRHGHWVKLWKACVGTKWDLIVDLRNTAVSRLLRADRRAYRPSHNTGRHRVEDNAAALSLSPPPSPRIWTDSQAESEADRLLSGCDKPFLALAPAANWPAKQWPIFNFTCLAQKLTAADGLLPNAKILIVAAPNEREQIEPLFNALPREQIIDGIGQNLLTVAACLKRCALFVGNDSGLMHIAAAVDAPTLGLFGPGYEHIYGPWGSRCAVARTNQSSTELLALTEYPGADYPNLMTGLSVGKAYEAARKLLDRVNNASF